MNSIFEQNSFPETLLSIVKFRETRGKTRAELAKAMGCQPAYFSQVLKEKVDLTEDHVAKLAEFLGLGFAETEYILLLLRLKKAGTTTLKNHLQSRLDEIRKANQMIESRVTASKVLSDEALKNYYSSSWQASVVHLATSCESFRTIAAIAARFSIGKNVVEFHLQQLEKFGLVEFKGGAWHFVGGSIHFPKGSPQDTQFQLARRLLAMQSMGSPVPGDLHYSVVFASNSKTYKSLHDKFLNFIEDFHSQVEPSSSEDVYAITMDLFRP